MLNKKIKGLPIFIWLLLAIFLARAFIYTSFIPPWQGPDEPQHYDYIHYLQTEKNLPVLGEVVFCDKVRSSLSKFYFNEYAREKNPYTRHGGLDTKEKIITQISHLDKVKNGEESKENIKQRNQIIQHPPLYYLAGAVLTWPFKNGSLLNSIYILRLFGALLGFGVVLLTYLTVALIYERNQYPAYAATAFVALNPMFTHVTTLVNNDTLTNFFFALFLFLLVRSLKYGFNIRRALSIGLVIGAGLLTKVFFGLAFILLVLAAIIFRSRIVSDYKLPLLSLGLGVLVSGAYYGRNLMLYKTLQPVFKFRMLDVSSYANMSFTKFLLESNFSQKFIISFWSNFGWIKPRFTGIYYRILMVIVIFALMGLAVYLVNLARKKETFELKLLSLFLFSIALLALVIAFNSYRGARVTGVVEGVQGRYLFSFIGVIGLIIYLGINRILSFDKGYLAFAALTFGMILLDLSAVFYYILPFYYF